MPFAWIKSNITNAQKEKIETYKQFKKSKQKKKSIDFKNREEH